MDASLQHLLDRAAIRDVMMRYAQAVDRRDWVLLETVFVPEVTGEFAGAPRANRDELIEFIAGVEFFEVSEHFMGHPWIEIDGDRAAMFTPSMLVHRGRNPDGSVIRYDTAEMPYREGLERRADQWQIVRRDEPVPEFVTGVRGLWSEDPVVAWLLDHAAIDDALTRWTQARNADGLSYVTTHHLGHPIVVFDSDHAEVALRAVLIERRGPIELASDALAWSPRWEELDISPLSLHFELKRRGEVFEIQHWEDASDPPSDVLVPPDGVSAEQAPLVDRLRLRDRIAREAWQADVAEPEGGIRLLGNQWLPEPGTLETYCLRVPQEGSWGDGAFRRIDSLVGEVGEVSIQATESRVLFGSEPDPR
ncbi:MAG: hypothetical protein CL908_09500 [Deltaproteobacteria bacterium]|jgi:hypothetical protein|nr:hypothetical protein [Deltaproteobacteria bacterium]